MMPTTLSRFTASALVLASVAAAAQPGLDRQADKAAARAQKALGKHDGDRAVEQAERAVAYAPRDAATRALLGRAYLAAGRFSSAEASFRDALALDPANQGAAMSLALCQIALGKWDVARVTLEGLRGKVSEADRGLALALAGDREGAIDALEIAARAEGADAKVRQNLALAYALDGRWSQARSTAGQDLSGAELDQRMREWAVFSQPRSAWDQVAMLMSVTPVNDPGLPAMLALKGSAAPEPTQVATADPVAPAPADPAPPMIAAAEPAVPEPVVAAADPAPAPAPAPEEVAVATAPASFKFAVPTTIPARRVAPLIAAPVKPAKVSLLRDDAPPAWYQHKSQSGGFVVQLGAFAKHGNVETAWNRASGHFGKLASFVPSSAAFALKGATLQRLVVSGFATRGDATRLCVAIKAKGGDCFVRAAAGEQPVQWVQRKTETRLASR